MSKGIFFMVEADSRSGMGHLRRAISLAKAFSEKGVNVIFSAAFMSQIAVEMLRALGFQVLSGKHTADEFQAVIFDGYGFQQKDLDHFSGLTTVLFEDFHHRSIATTLVIDANISQYSLRDFGSIQFEHLLEGQDYICLDRASVATRNRKSNRFLRTNSYLVTLGGADPRALTPEVLRSMLFVGKSDARIGAVLGPFFERHAYPDEQLVDAFKNLVLFHGPDGLGDVYRQYNRVVGAAGTAAYERVFHGIPSLNLVTEDNQVRLAEGLESRGLALALDARSGVDQDKFTTLIKRLDDKSSFPNLEKSIIDGGGPSRIASKILELTKND